MLPLIMLGVSMFAGAMQQGQANAEKSKDYVNSLKPVNAQNKAIAEANITNTIRTGYRVSILNVQRGQARKQAVEAGYDLSARGIDAVSTNAANAAASGTIGSSVDAVAGNIRKKVEDAQLDLDENFDVMEMNFDQQLHDTVQQGIDSLQSPINPDTSGPAYGSQTRAALMAGLASGASLATQYGVAKMKLDLGTPVRGVDSATASQPSIPNVGGGYSYKPMK